MIVIYNPKYYAPMILHTPGTVHSPLGYSPACSNVTLCNIQTALPSPWAQCRLAQPRLLQMALRAPGCKRNLWHLRTPIPLHTHTHTIYPLSMARAIDSLLPWNTSVHTWEMRGLELE